MVPDWPNQKLGCHLQIYVKFNPKQAGYGTDSAPSMFFLNNF